MKLDDMIISLCSIAGPSGFEDRAREAAGDMLAPFVDEIHTDVMGNLLAVKRCGKENAKSMLLDAHVDEIGMIVTGYAGGFLRFGNLGGIDPRMLPAREVKIMTPEPMFGVIDTMPPHVLEAGEADKSIPADKLFVDVGLSEDEVKKRVPLGTPIVFDGGCAHLGQSMLCGKALDDRSCVAIIIKAFEKLQGKALDVDVWALISTQEELGCRGAIPGAYGVHPDYAIALDVTHAWTPDAKKHDTMELGKGAAVGVGPGMNRRLTDAIFAVAEAESIPVQTEVLPGNTGTNGWVIQVTREGVATGLISLPVKYMHTPLETAAISDAEACADLLAAFVQKAGEVL